MSDILIVDDHPVVVEGLQKLILSKGIAKTCISSYSYAECTKALAVYNPDLILLDYHLPDGNGIDLCKYIKKKDIKIKVLVISSFKEYSIVNLMKASGASGFLLKNSSEDEIIEAIKTVLAGKTYFCKESQNIINEHDSHTIVTGREMEVLKLIAAGFTNIEIAEQLFISPLTVDRHRTNLIIKLNAKNTASLICIAMGKGYI